VRSERIVALLKSIAFPSRATVDDFSADEPARQRIERARLLRSAALDDFADQELRYAARHGVRPVPLAMELAEAAQRAGEPDRALRYIKGMVPGYLGIPTSHGPRRFWELAFPLPYREPLERYAEQRSLDPYLLAGMIRQESEFNKEAVSRADARGLTQVMPRTGRELSRKVGMKRFTTRMLFNPEVNLRLGTFYFRTLGNSLDGNWEATLAAYNGGKSRVDRWLQWGPFREPAEFIESIPITETREYVMVVQRNGEIYRRLYENQPAPVSSSVTPAKPTAKAKGTNDASKNVRRSGSKSKRAPAVPKR
jgi:soluble lytic murein transglycosylase